MKLHRLENAGFKIEIRNYLKGREMNKFYQDFGKVVRERRKRYKFRQVDLANLVEVSRGTIVSIEAGRFAVNFELAVRLISILGIDFYGDLHV